MYDSLPTKIVVEISFGFPTLLAFRNASHRPYQKNQGLCFIWHVYVRISTNLIRFHSTTVVSFVCVAISSRLTVGYPLGDVARCDVGTILRIQNFGRRSVC